MNNAEFSFRTRSEALRKFQTESFDLLVVGGGITGAAVARDAASRGLKVALVEKSDFAFGTSSRSSKLIHGGLRYLQNLEFRMVFEALSERAHLLKTAPHLVRPLPFYLPIYSGDKRGRLLINFGLWLYDLLSMFRTPGFHRLLSKKKLLREIPFLKSEGLKGGFRYFDASMWDDVLAVETARAAHFQGACVANYVEAQSPIWDGKFIQGFEVEDKAPWLSQSPELTKWNLRASRTVFCLGPWTDQMGAQVSPQWKPWLKPSKGVHLVFDLKRIPIAGSVVMTHPSDGRISFVIPRPDFGSGVVIVGTTDGPCASDPDASKVDEQDVHYLLGLLDLYFPDLHIHTDDIVSAYVGVRPLVGGTTYMTGSEGQNESPALQKVSREHQIAQGPGGITVVAGGKYTTHQNMAVEIVDSVLENWELDAKQPRCPALPTRIGPSKTRAPVNPRAVGPIPPGFPVELQERYGAEIQELKKYRGHPEMNLPGFPWLDAQLRFGINREMIIRLEDFYIRRIPLFLSRKDHGLECAESLVNIFAQEMHLRDDTAQKELQALRDELDRRLEWTRCIIQGKHS